MHSLFTQNLLLLRIRFHDGVASHHRFIGDVPSTRLPGRARASESIILAKPMAYITLVMEDTARVEHWMRVKIFNRW